MKAKLVSRCCMKSSLMHVVAHFEGCYLSMIYMSCCLISILWPAKTQILFPKLLHRNTIEKHPTMPMHEWHLAWVHVGIGDTFSWHWVFPVWHCWLLIVLDMPMLCHGWHGWTLIVLVVPMPRKAWLDTPCGSHAHVVPRMVKLDTLCANRPKDDMVGHFLC